MRSEQKGVKGVGKSQSMDSCQRPVRTATHPNGCGFQDVKAACMTLT